MAENELRLSALIGALGFAIDISEGQPEGHGARACLIGMRLGRAIGLSEESLWELYYTLQLKDLGRNTTTGLVCAGESAFALRSSRVASIAKQLELGEWVVASIQCVEARWDGRGQPALMGARIPLYSRIAALAEITELLHAAAGPVTALAQVRRQSGTSFDPALVDALSALGPADDLWNRLYAPDLTQALLAEEPARFSRRIDERYLDQIAAAFGALIDTRSPYTKDHSERVAFYTDLLAAELGIGDDRRRWLRRGALLHDLGKLGVKRAVLEKPAHLDAAETHAVRRHAGYTEEILTRIPHFAELARVAGSHHERLDGTGYPRGLTAEQIPLETRIITAADIFDAISSERPYHKANSFQETLDIMSPTVGTALDQECFEALVRVVEELEYAGSPTVPVAA